MINYLLDNSYITRILRGIFYINSMEERKKKTSNISFYSAISEALKIKGVKNWYFGLESAIKLNNLTHEYFVIDFIISDKIKRPRPIMILGHKVKFVKIKKELTTFGIKKENIPYSDIEKTILDMVYLGIYKGSSESSIKNDIIDYIDKCNKAKLINYAEHYPKTILKFIQKIK
jgi:predicted transcriptional regulator of viral defense system